MSLYMKLYYGNTGVFGGLQINKLHICLTRSNGLANLDTDLVIRVGIVRFYPSSTKLNQAATILVAYK